jgi:hypothetical protein
MLAVSSEAIAWSRVQPRVLPKPGLRHALRAPEWEAAPEDLIPQIRNVDVDAQPDVISEIIAVVVRIGIDGDVVVIP